jgi:DNA primase
VLYGLYESRRKIQERGSVIVCEGYLDLVRLHEFGFGHTVAASGTAFTPEQARLLARYARTAVLLFDADGPGMTAALRSVPVLFDAGLDVSIARLGSGEDPDTFLLKAGAEALQRLIADALGYVAYCEAQTGGSFSALGPGEQNRLIDEMARTVARITDPVRRDLVGRTVWSRFGISEAAFRKRLLQAEAGAAQTDGRERPDAGSVALAAGWHSELLQFLLLNPAARAEARGLVPPGEFDDPVEGLLLDLLLLPEHEDLDAGSLMRRTNDRKAIALMGRLAAAEIPFAGSELPDYVRKLKRKRLEEEARQLLRQMRELELQGDTDRIEDVAAAYREAREAWVRLEKEGRNKGG